MFSFEVFIVNESLDFEAFCRQYNNEEVCIQALFSIKWPEGFVCPRCAHQEYYLIRSRKLPLYECRSCRLQTSLITGTIFEGTRTLLTVWFKALFLHAQPQGISATRLSTIIGTTYKTAWLICHKIRHIMSQFDSQELLTSLVRVNWGVYGNPYNPTVFRHPQEQPLLTGATISESGQFSYIKIKKVSDKYLQDNHIAISAGLAFSSQHVDPAAKEVIIINQKFSRDRSIPLIHLCRKAARWINDTFNGIGSKHLQSYLDQFCFGFNMINRSQNIFVTLFQLSALTPTIKYPILILRENRSPKHKHEYMILLRKAS
jgi:transposase-like protein